MSLPERLQKIKGFLGLHDALIATILHLSLILGVGTGAYFLGVERPSYERGMGVSVFSPSSESLPISDTRELLSAVGPIETTPERNFVASSQGTKYHRLDCPGAQTIKEGNKIHFSSEDEARQAGFSPAGNCPGLR